MITLPRRWARHGKSCKATRSRKNGSKEGRKGGSEAVVRAVAGAEALDLGADTD